MLTRSRQSGLTIIEIVIGLAIIALLLVMGLPSYSTWIMNTQIRNAAEATLNGLQLARNEAVRRNTNVEFAFGASSDWTVSVPGEVLQARSAAEGSNRVAAVASGGTKVTFSSIGRVTANGDGSAAFTQVDFDVPDQAEASRELRIVVSATGNVRMCDPHTNIKEADPRRCP